MVFDKILCKLIKKKTVSGWDVLNAVIIYICVGLLIVTVGLVIATVIFALYLDFLICFRKIYHPIDGDCFFWTFGHGVILFAILTRCGPVLKLVDGMLSKPIAECPERKEENEKKTE
jgi:heme/copper-type cytochrome/quinol oxidase subunit 1